MSNFLDIKDNDIIEIISKITIKNDLEVIRPNSSRINGNCHWWLEEREMLGITPVGTF